MIAWLRASVAFVVRVGRTFVASDGLLHAGTIAYFGLLSILPFALLAAAIIARLATGLPGAEGKTAIDQVLDPLQNALPYLTGDVRELIRSLAGTRTSFSILSTVLLLLSATLVFNAIEHGVNAVLRSTERRHFMVTRVMVAGLVVASAAALFAWQLLRSLVASWFDRTGLQLPSWLVQGELIQLVFSLGVLAVGFYVLVKVMSVERYSRGDRWIGAGVFAGLFQLAHLGLETYLSHVVKLEKLYGTAGAFFGLILWLYVAAIVFLVSCSVIRAISEIRSEPKV